MSTKGVLTQNDGTERCGELSRAHTLPSASNPRPCTPAIKFRDSTQDSLQLLEACQGFVMGFTKPKHETFLAIRYR